MELDSISDIHIEAHSNMDTQQKKTQTNFKVCAVIHHNVKSMKTPLKKQLTTHSILYSLQSAHIVTLE